jgi:hypothetical protein
MNTQTQSSGARRQHQRPTKSGVRVICQRGELYLGPNIAESVADASAEALGVLVREALGVGERVSVSLEGVGPPMSIMRLGRTAWCGPAAGGLFHAEVELDSPLEYPELMSLCTI